MPALMRASRIRMCSTRKSQHGSARAAMRSPCRVCGATSESVARAAESLPRTSGTLYPSSRASREAEPLCPCSRGTLSHLPGSVASRPDPPAARRRRAHEDVGGPADGDVGGPALRVMQKGAAVGSELRFSAKNEALTLACSPRRAVRTADVTVGRSARVLAGTLSRDTLPLGERFGSDLCFSEKSEALTPRDGPSTARTIGPACRFFPRTSHGCASGETVGAWPHVHRQVESNCSVLL